jgi:hypothetical protein
MWSPLPRMASCLLSRPWFSTFCSHLNTVIVIERLRRTNAPWGIARLSQVAKLANQDATALTFTYTFDSSAGSGVDIYIVGEKLAYWRPRLQPANTPLSQTLVSLSIAYLFTLFDFPVGVFTTHVSYLSSITQIFNGLRLLASDSVWWPCQVGSNIWPLRVSIQLSCVLSDD